MESEQSPWIKVYNKEKHELNLCSKYLFSVVRAKLTLNWIRDIVRS